MATEVLKGFSPGVFYRLCVTHNKNLEQRKFRTKERTNSISLFKSNSESYGCQPRQLMGSTPSSIFLDTSWIYVYKLRQLTGSIASSIFRQLWKLQSGMSTPTVEKILVAPESYVVNSDSWVEHSVFQVFVALKAAGTSALKVIEILVALKATVDRNVNFHCWLEFGSSERYSRQECQLPLLTGFL